VHEAQPLFAGILLEFLLFLVYKHELIAQETWMTTWSEDFLLIRYPDLGVNAAERLTLLRAIGVLLDKPAGSYTSTLLGLDLNEWDILYKWVSEGNGALFWQIELQNLRILRTCEKHILVGTAQLLRDLRLTTVRKPAPQQILEDLLHSHERG
jgi:hypothetical protein